MTNGQEAYVKMLTISNYLGNANWNHNENITSHLSEWRLSKRQETTSIGEDAKKREPCALPVGMQIDAATVENSMEILKKIKNRTVMWFSYYTSGYLSEEHKKANQKDMCNPAFTNRWIDKDEIYK